MSNYEKHPTIKAIDDFTDDVFGVVVGAILALIGFGIPILILLFMIKVVFG